MGLTRPPSIRATFHPLRMRIGRAPIHRLFQNARHVEPVFRPVQHHGIGEDGRIQGELQSTGIRPTFTERFLMSGVRLPDLMFQSVPER